MTHTPGPWAAIIDGVNSRKPKKDPHPMAMVRAGGSQCIDATGSGDTFAESAANARLIAAAPDLFAALKEMIAWAPRLSLADQPQNQPMRDSVIAWGRVVRDAQAIIRKAEGK